MISFMLSHSEQGNVILKVEKVLQSKEQVGVWSIQLIELFLLGICSGILEVPVMNPITT